MTARVASGCVRVLGTGRCLPGAPLSSAELLERIHTHFGLPTRVGAALARRLGVRHRHYARDWQQSHEAPRPGQRNPELAAAAVQAALDESGCPVSALQYLIGHTTSPARPLPPNISEVAERLGLTAPYAELRQACTGFANALQWASAMLAVRDAPPVAIVGSEVGSMFLDPARLSVAPDQWVNLMQMGDGAGAIVLGPDDGGEGARIESAFFGHIGGLPSGISLEDAGSDHPTLRSGHIVASFDQDFAAVRRDGEALFDAGLATAKQAGVKLHEMAMILPHQASGKIGELMSRALGLPLDRFFVNADHVGNLGSAAIWVALDELRGSGRLSPGDRVLVLGAEASKYMYGGFVYIHG